jgi:ArsR family metal-binding transcriptional regulator
MTIYADRVIITQVQDAAEGLELLAALAEAVNAVWDKRRELVAQTTRKRAPRHLDIWELLPRTNCRQCGEATCLAFAVGLLQQNRELDECLPLMVDSALAGRRTTLETLL